MTKSFKIQLYIIMGILASFIIIPAIFGLWNHNKEIKQEPVQVQVSDKSSVPINTDSVSEVTSSIPIETSVYETGFERKSREMGIIIGTPADDVLAIRGKPPYPSEVVGKDINGLIIEWEYPDGIYVLRRWTVNGITCYRVSEMKL
ncbi:MAG: hypothetical protein ABII96_08450 [Candidatus Zixiibacteriota bacterium]